MAVPLSAAAQSENPYDALSEYTASVQCVLPALPEPHANNAVAQLTIGGRTHLFSFMGLTAGKSRADISRAAFELVVGEQRWTALPDVPVEAGRLASTAVGLRGQVYVFGGYTVAEDGSEVSTLHVFAYNPGTKAYVRKADIPVPVDDTVSFTYLDRYVYLVSGWHDVGNLSRIQMYDAETDTWAERVDEFPGKQVFGHMGAAVDNVFVILDGVAVVGIKEGRREFDLWPQAYAGTIDPSNPVAINWRRLPKFERAPVYRGAAIGDPVLGRIIFAGGSTTAYNYSGIGYDGTPAEPLSQAFAWNIAADRWERLSDLEMPSMDHRGMVRIGDGFYTIGGMTRDQTVTGELSPVAGAPDCAITGTDETP